MMKIKRQANGHTILARAARLRCLGFAAALLDCKVARYYCGTATLHSTTYVRTEYSRDRWPSSHSTTMV